MVQCWLGNDVVSLPDMNTELDSVKTIWDSWAKDIIANYTSMYFFISRFCGLLLILQVDGMRIDAAKHVDKPFWTQFQSAADLYTVGEVFDDSITENCDYMSDALSGVLNYPMFDALNFSSHLHQLADIHQVLHSQFHLHDLPSS